MSKARAPVNPEFTDFIAAARGPGDLEFHGAQFSVESLILYAIIRPRTYARSWKRSGAALLLFFPWLAVCAILLMHQPPYVFMHFFWLLLVNLILVVLCIYSAVAQLGRR